MKLEFSAILSLLFVQGYYSFHANFNRFHPNRKQHDKSMIYSSNNNNNNHNNNNNNDNKSNIIPQSNSVIYSNRLQKYIQTASSIILPLLTLSSSISKSNAATDTTIEPINDSLAPNPTVSTSSSTNSNNNPNTNKITSIAYLNIKIANYTEESIGQNKAADGSGRLIIGLYGNDAPRSVARFLETITSDGMKLPTFLNSQFSRIVDETLLQIDDVPRLEVANIAGVEQYQYEGNILTDYTPILEANTLRHDKRGLLTRRQLTAGPEFGITLKPSAELDNFHVVFGIVLQGQEVLDAISNVPTYTYQTSTGYAGKQKGLESGLADAWFQGQKSFFVTAGRLAGDRRAIDRRGKLLRRVRIIGTGVLDKNFKY